MACADLLLGTAADQAIETNGLCHTDALLGSDKLNSIHGELNQLVVHRRSELSGLHERHETELDDPLQALPKAPELPSEHHRQAIGREERMAADYVQQLPVQTFHC
jgi:hypothetical protein